MRSLLLLVLFLPSCSALEKLEKTADRLFETATRLASTEIDTAKVSKVLDDVTTVASSLGDKGQAIAAKAVEFREVIARADVNKDGKIAGLGEWKDLIYGAIALALGWFTSKKASITQVKEVKQEVKADIAKTQGEVDETWEATKHIQLAVPPRAKIDAGPWPLDQQPLASATGPVRPLPS